MQDVFSHFGDFSLLPGKPAHDELGQEHLPNAEHKESAPQPCVQASHLETRSAAGPLRRDIGICPFMPWIFYGSLLSKDFTYA